MNWVPISKIKHLNKGLIREPNYLFAKGDLLVPVSHFELPEAVAVCPLLFGHSEDQVRLFSVMGLEKGENLFVHENGSWVTSFVPAYFRSHPFALGVLDEEKGTILINEESELIVDRRDGRPFFNEDGTEGEILKERIRLLTHLKTSKTYIEKACALLLEFDLLEPFDKIFENKESKSVKFDGLLSIKVPEFRALGDDKFLKLKATLGIDLVYAHLYSIRRFPFLLSLMKNRRSNKSSLKDLGKDIFGSPENEIDFNLG
jgi:hypothetical protein